MAKTMSIIKFLLFEPLFSVKKNIFPWLGKNTFFCNSSTLLLTFNRLVIVAS